MEQTHRKYHKKKTENRENRIVLAQEALLVLPILQLLVELHKNIKLYRPY